MTPVALIDAAEPGRPEPGRERDRPVCDVARVVPGRDLLAGPGERLARGRDRCGMREMGERRRAGKAVDRGQLAALHA